MTQTAPAQRARNTPAFEDIRYQIEGPTAIITINRPQARNAMLFGMYQRIQELAEQINADPSIRVWVLTGAGGKAFASGTDNAVLWPACARSTLPP